jgi:hypothetical protein
MHFWKHAPIIPTIRGDAAGGKSILYTGRTGGISWPDEGWNDPRATSKFSKLLKTTDPDLNNQDVQPGSITKIHNYNP